MQEKIIVTSPSINEHTMEQMKKFFMETSIPRIMEAKQNERKGA